jgi:sigma-B regulation protein RsbU (phosphoserine phosphatase)
VREHKDNMVKQMTRAKSRKAAKSGGPPLDLVREVDDLGLEVFSPLDPHQVMEALVKRLVSRYEVALVGIWQLDEANSTLELGATAGKPKLPPELKKTPLENSLLGKIVKERTPQVYKATDGTGGELALWAREQELSFLAAYPLLLDAEVHGVLLLACMKSPTEPLLALFQLHARLVSLALRDAKLLSSTRRRLTKLSFLVDASKALSSTLDLAELLGRIMDLAKTHTDAERGTLYLVDESTHEIWSLIAHGMERQEIRLPVGHGIAGFVAQTGETLNIPNAYAEPRFNAQVDQQTGFRTRNILCLPIRSKTGKVIAALQLLNKRQGDFTDEDADFLRTLSAHMGLALENARLHQELLVKESLEKEMALARGIQRSLLPEAVPNMPGFEVALLNEPCHAVGGDYYDFLNLDDDNLLLVIADVEGMGIGSALVMSNLQATLRALVLTPHSLNEIADSLNQMILAGTRGEKFLSIFLGKLNIKQKSLQYVNCGHPPPVIMRADQGGISLGEGGVVIGLFENVQYKGGQTELRPGDVLLLWTDGITESMNAEHELYGFERLAACVQPLARRPAQEIVNAVSASLTAFSRQGTHIDDKVLIVVKVL